ncbi:MAG: branched-chain amino acid ABC transporter permease [Candidatus Dormibacteria bacterium]
MPALTLASGFGQLFLAQTIAGFVLGGIFTLSAIGIVLVYRVTGVLNFAQGAMGMFCTFIAWWVIHYVHPLAPNAGVAFKSLPSIAVGVLCALAFSVLLGLALEAAVFRWLRGRPALVKAVITVGILLFLQSVAALLFGSTQYHEAIKFFDPTHCPPTNSACYTWFPGGNFGIGYDQLLVIAVSLLLAGGLFVFLKVARIGVAMRAVSEDAVAASLWGLPVGASGALAWVMGSVVATIAGVLLISVGVSFDTVSLTVLVVDALAVAMIAGLVSLPLTVLGGFGLGLLETYPKLYIASPGLPHFIAILVILGALLARSDRSLLRGKA